MILKVVDKKTGAERTVTEKAYKLIPGRYRVLGQLTDEGELVDYAIQIKSSPVAKKNGVVGRTKNVDVDIKEVREIPDLGPEGSFAEPIEEEQPLENKTAEPAVETKDSAPLAAAAAPVKKAPAPVTPRKTPIVRRTGPSTTAKPS